MQQRFGSTAGTRAGMPSTSVQPSHNRDIEAQTWASKRLAVAVLWAASQADQEEAWSSARLYPSFPRDFRILSHSSTRQVLRDVLRLDLGSSS